MGTRFRGAFATSVALVGCSVVASTDGLQSAASAGGTGGVNLLGDGSAGTSAGTGGAAGSAGAPEGGAAAGGTAGTGGGAGAGGDAGGTTARCGNGEREGAEACDDGNAVETDRCKSDCTINCSSNGSPGSLAQVDPRDGTCFVFIDVGVRNPDYLRACGGLGDGFKGAKVEDAQRRQFLQAWLGASVRGDAWVGATQDDGAATPSAGWTWPDGSALPGDWPIWDIAQPDDAFNAEGGRENCAMLSRSGAALVASDTPCSSYAEHSLCSRP